MPPPRVPLAATAFLLSLFTLHSSHFTFSQCAPDTLLQTVPNPAPGMYDQFGVSVAVFGNMAVVGAWFDNVGGVNAGTAYVFHATTGALIATLNNPTPALNDWFGYSVAISGNVAVVGASLDDTGAVDAGAAYVFNATTGALITTLNNPDPPGNDRFGFSVAIFGNVAVVGAYQDDTGAADAGTAYVFNTTTGALMATLNNPAPAASDGFGASVAISGNVAVVGAIYDDAGATDAGTVYIFNAATGALLATLSNPTPAASDFFGDSVAVSGNLVVVGADLDDAGATDAGTVYVFNATTGALTATLSNPAPAAYYQFGVSVAVSGNVAAVGAIAGDNAAAPNEAAAYVFNATTGAIMATLNNPAPAPFDYFSRVAVSGNVAVVGAFLDDTGTENTGSVYVFSCGSTIGIRDYLLGRREDPSGLDLNADTSIDIADLILTGL